MDPYVPEKLPLAKGVIDWAEHVTLIGKANAALARYDGILHGMVNPEVLLSPLTTQEAVVSSRIEGTITSLEEVLQFEASPPTDVSPEKRDEIQEVINYRQAVRAAVNDMNKRPPCINMIRDLHRILLASVRGQDKTPGEIRRTQNYIAPPGTPIERATFVPPAPSDVMPALYNWEEYLHAEDKDPLVQLAIAKAQFEIIHPFCDGNGRIGRMLIPLILYNKGILLSPVFYISGYLDRNHEEYFQRLKAVSQGHDWNGWIAFFLQAVIEQADENSHKARTIIDLYSEMLHRVSEVTHSRFVVQTIDAIFDRPIFASNHFVSRSGIPRDSALRILRQLGDSGILITLRESSGRTPAMLYFPSLLNIAEGA